MQFSYRLFSIIPLEICVSQNFSRDLQSHQEKYWKQCLSKILEGKQKALWYFWKRLILLNIALTNEFTDKLHIHLQITGQSIDCMHSIIIVISKTNVSLSVMWQCVFCHFLHLYELKSHSMGCNSHRTGNETWLVTYFWVVLYNSHSFALDLAHGENVDVRNNNTHCKTLG